MIVTKTIDGRDLILLDHISLMRLKPITDKERSRVMELQKKVVSLSKEFGVKSKLDGKK